MSIASIAKASGCRWFGVISSSGANIKSPFLYMHTKGEMEAAIKTMGFENLCIYKPGFIQCGRRINRRPVSGDAEHETSSEKHSKPYNFFENLCKSSLFNKKYVIIDHGGLGINTKAKSNEASSVQIPKSIENSTELGTIVEDDEDTTHNGSTIRSPIFDEKDSQNEKLGPEKNSFLKYSSFSETQESEKVINVLDHLRETPQTSLSLKDLPKKFYTEYEEVEDVRCLERLTGATIIPILNLISRERASISKETVAKAMILDALESGIASDRYRLKIVSNRAMIDGVRLSGRMS